MLLCDGNRDHTFANRAFSCFVPGHFEWKGSTLVTISNADFCGKELSHIHDDSIYFMSFRDILAIQSSRCDLSFRF